MAPAAAKTSKKSLIGWNCSNCTYRHEYPSNRCAMCGELRGATRKEMQDFVLGKPVPDKSLGNVVELLSSSPPEDQTNNASGITTKSTANGHNNNNNKENKNAMRPFLTAKPKPAPRPWDNNSNNKTTAPEQIKKREHPTHVFFAKKKATSATGFRNPYQSSSTKVPTHASGELKPPPQSSQWPDLPPNTALHPPAPPRQSPTIGNNNVTGQNDTRKPAPQPATATNTVSNNKANPSRINQPLQQRVPVAANALDPHASLPPNAARQPAPTSSAVSNSNAPAANSLNPPLNAPAQSSIQPAAPAAGNAFFNCKAHATKAHPPPQRQAATTSLHNRLPPSRPAATSRKSSDKKLKHTPFSAARSQSYVEGSIPLCPETSTTWIYPKNPKYEIRNYQFKITETALLHNTLVSLPTGLGKTLIAAVVLYNYYRWFPTGKVVFMAPTNPLVKQQVEACFKIMGLPERDTAMMTGHMNPLHRTSIWQSHRVFYCTPQTVEKDWAAQPDLAKSVVCIVLDEAHKASGEYAYTRVITQLEQAGAKYRVVGLSATPGTSIKAIQSVIQQLRTAKLEVRSEDDDEVKQFLHNKHTELVIVPKNDSQKQAEKMLSDILDPHLEKLRSENVITYKHGGNATITGYQVLMAMNDYAKRTDRRGHVQGLLYAVHKLVSIRHDIHQSLNTVKVKLLSLANNPQRGILSTIVKSEQFRQLLELVTSDDGKPSNSPKLHKLGEVLKEHFHRAEACGRSTRVIVFAELRDTVGEIVRHLESLRPMVRPRHFVGQNNSSKKDNNNTVVDDGDMASTAQPQGLNGMKQNEQAEVILKFRDGTYNVLVCTSIGEEGLDIGEVDLIVHFDMLRSAIRNIQRTGRTGRARDGRVVKLICEGQEEKTYRQGVSSQKTLLRALKSPGKFSMVPHQPMFPAPPTLEMREMQITKELDWSLVVTDSKRGSTGTTGGASSRMKKPSSWKLTNEQESERMQQLGPIVGLQHLSWKTLRRAFLRARGQQSRGKGTTVQILKTLERRFPTVVHGTSSSGRRGGNWSIQKIFPLQPSLDDVDFEWHQRVATIAGDSWSNLAAVNTYNTKQQVEASHSVVGTFPVQQPVAPIQSDSEMTTTGQRNPVSTTSYHLNSAESNPGMVTAHPVDQSVRSKGEVVPPTNNPYQRTVARAPIQSTCETAIGQTNSHPAASDTNPDCVAVTAHTKNHQVVNNNFELQGATSVRKNQAVARNPYGPRPQSPACAPVEATHLETNATETRNVGLRRDALHENVPAETNGLTSQAPAGAMTSNPSSSDSSQMNRSRANHTVNESCAVSVLSQKPTTDDATPVEAHRLEKSPVEAHDLAQRRDARRGHEALERMPAETNLPSTGHQEPPWATMNESSTKLDGAPKDQAVSESAGSEVLVAESVSAPACELEPPVSLGHEGPHGSPARPFLQIAKMTEQNYCAPMFRLPSPAPSSSSSSSEDEEDDMSETKGFRAPRDSESITRQPVQVDNIFRPPDGADSEQPLVFRLHTQDSSSSSSEDESESEEVVVNEKSQPLAFPAASFGSSGEDSDSEEDVPLFSLRKPKKDPPLISLRTHKTDPPLISLRTPKKEVSLVSLRKKGDQRKPSISNNGGVSNYTSENSNTSPKANALLRPCTDPPSPTKVATSISDPTNETISDSSIKHKDEAQSIEPGVVMGPACSQANISGHCFAEATAAAVCDIDLEEGYAASSVNRKIGHDPGLPGRQKVAGKEASDLATVPEPTVRDDAAGCSPIPKNAGNVFEDHMSSDIDASPPVMVATTKRKRRHISTTQSSPESHGCLDDTPFTGHDEPNTQSGTMTEQIDVLADTPERTIASHRMINSAKRKKIDSLCTPEPPSQSNILVDTPSTSVARLAKHSALTDTPLYSGSSSPPLASSDPSNIVCAVCFSPDSLDEDPIVLCDGECSLAYHQSCYNFTADLNSDKPWFCDQCVHLKGGRANARIVCKYCGSSDGPLKILPAGGWYHPLCADFNQRSASAQCSLCSKAGAVKCFGCTVSSHPHCALLGSGTGNWTLIRVGNAQDGSKLRSAMFCPHHTESVTTFLAEQEDATSIRLIQTRQQDKHHHDRQVKKLNIGKSTTNDLSPIATAEVIDVDTPHSEDEKRKRQERRRQVLARFALEEADIDGDGDDAAEDEMVVQLEEDELSHDSFINDSAHLSQHFSQDDLADVDPDSLAELDFQHRAVDAQRERDNQFTTPLFNRRMKNRDDSQQSGSSEAGLGNMHFIRSVLEHHRNGGSAEEIERFYNTVAREEAHNNDHGSPTVASQGTPQGASAIAQSDVVDGNQAPGQTLRLTEEQRARIESNRLEALRRRQRQLNHRN